MDKSELYTKYIKGNLREKYEIELILKNDEIISNHHKEFRKLHNGTNTKNRFNEEYNNKLYFIVKKTYTDMRNYIKNAKINNIFNII